jgi:hypothetical protein
MERFNKLLATLTSLITGILGLMGAIASLWARVREEIPFVRDIPLPYVALSSVILIGITVFIAWKYRSRARAPLGLARALDIGNRYLEGRGDDIDRLLRHLNDFPVVWLIGESGAGKSSLLKRGLLPELQKSRSHLGLFIDNWGADWVEGPQRALAKALLRSAEDSGLDAAIPTNLQIDEAFRFITGLTEITGRIPILIFDQFDDYQTRHQDLFLSPQRTFLSADQLVEHNDFWRNIQTLVALDRIHCLFATRIDSQWSLESVRFKDPKIYVLGRIENSFAAELLRSIFSSQATPLDTQFETLQIRLIRDLGPDGWILPIQMRVAFRGLAGLPHLDIRSYEDEGGLAGLEALHVNLSVAEAARKSGLSLRDALKVLVLMTERSSEKTVPRTEAELYELSQLHTAPSSFRTLLEELEASDIVRQRVDQDLGRVVWLLDHDYLLRGILALDIRTRRWPLLLEDSYSSFRFAQGIWRKGLALLPPLTQIRLIWERLRGRLRYGKARWFACLSGIRFAANIWMLLMIAALYIFHRTTTQQEADQIFSALGIQEPPPLQEKIALRRLAQARSQVRAAVIEKALELPSNAQRFNRRHGSILNAAAGLSEKTRNAILDDVVRPRCADLENKESSEIVKACAILILTLDEPSKEGVQLAIRALAIDPGALGRFHPRNSPSETIIEAVKVWASIASDSTRGEISNLLINSVKRTKSPAEAFAIAKMFFLFNKDHNPDLRYEFCHLLVPNLSTSPDHLQSSITTLSLCASDAVLKDSDIPQKLFRTIISMNDEYYIPPEIYESTSLLAAKLPTSIADQDCRLILAEMYDISAQLKNNKHQQSPYTRRSLKSKLSRLATLLGLFNERISLDASREAITLLITSVGWDRDEFAILATGLGALSPFLPGDIADHFVHSLLSEMENPDAPNTTTYVAMLGLYKPKLDGPIAQRIAVAILKKLDMTTNYFAIDSLLDVFATTGHELAPESKKRAIMIGLSTIENSPNTMSSRMIHSIRLLLAELPNRERQGITEYIIGVLAKPHLTDMQVYSLSSIVDSISSSLTPDASWRAYNRILDALDKRDFQPATEDDTAVLASLGAGFSSPRVDQAMSRLLRHFSNSGGSDCSLAASLVRPENLQTIVNVMKLPMCNPSEQGMLIEAIGKMAGQSFGVTDEDGQFIPNIRSFLKWADQKKLDTESAPAK